VISIAAFPLIVPAALFGVGAGLATSTAPPARRTVVAAAVSCAIADAASFSLLVLNPGQYEYHTAAGGEGGDMVRPGLACVAIAIMFGALLVTAGVACRDRKGAAGRIGPARPAPTDS
jgi:hypothetical protein